MRRWTLILCFLAAARTSHADKECLFGTCGNIDSPTRSSGSGSTDTVRNDNNDSSDAQPSRPKGTSQRDLQKNRQQYELIRQGERALKRGKYAEAVRHLERANAPMILGVAQHKLGLLWFKQKHYLAGRWKVEAAIRNDPDDQSYKDTLALMHEKWCRANRPLFPDNLSGGDDEMGFHSTAIGICEAKVAEAKRGEWQCAWLAQECMGF
jgi:hypothetical protein